MKPYTPQSLPLSNIERIRLISLVGEANASLARYDGLFDKPIFTTANISKRANIPKPAVSKLINVLLEEGVLDTVRAGAGRRAAILTFAELLNRLEQK